jgi:hypothetical protein
MKSQPEQSAEDQTNTHRTMADAVRYRDGLMIALLACVPLRLSNFVGLEIDRDLIKEDVKRRRALRLGVQPNYGEIHQRPAWHSDHIARRARCSSNDVGHRRAQPNWGCS